MRAISALRATGGYAWRLWNKQLFQSKDNYFLEQGQYQFGKNLLRLTFLCQTRKKIIPKEWSSFLSNVPSAFEPMASKCRMCWIWNNGPRGSWGYARPGLARPGFFALCPVGFEKFPNKVIGQLYFSL